MTVVTQLYLGKFLKINYMFRPLIEWTIIRLKQEITEKITQDNMYHTRTKHVVDFQEFSQI
jgi:hypothetical protein